MTKKTHMSRRALLAGLGATTGALAGCGDNRSREDRESMAMRIDARVDVTRDYLFETYPYTRDLAAQASGILYMPLVSEATFFYGGAFGRGALRINGQTVDYYTSARASFGVQFGAQQYAHALFFMGAFVLEEFRSSDGWALEGELRYATPEEGETFSQNAAGFDDVIPFVFGQQGIILGASLSGTKYTRIVL